MKNTIFNKNEKISIAYPPGAYGHYLIWLLATLSDDLPVRLPFTNGGTSHMFVHPLLKSHAFNKCIADTSITKEDMPLISHMHPTIKDVAFNDGLKRLHDLTDKTILLYPKKEEKVFLFSNYLHKVYNNFSFFLHKCNLVESLTSNWGVTEEQVLKHAVPVYIKREFLALYAVEAWESEVDWFWPDNNKTNDQTLLVYVDDLLHNFENTMENIRVFLEVDWSKDISEVREAHKINLSLQRYLHQSTLTSKILKSIDEGSNVSWRPEELSLASEAFIQKELLSRGIALKCFELNDFPSSTEDLKKVFE